MDNAAFEEMLAGRREEPPHDQRWALVRLIEYAPWSELRRLLPREFFFAAWPELASRVRSKTRREGMDFFYKWHRGKAASNA